MRPLFLALLLLLPLANAHPVGDTFLRGARLCLDPSSVQVEVRGDGIQPDDLHMSLMHRRLTQSLPAILEARRVAFEARESCAGSSSFVQLRLLVFHLHARGLEVSDDYPYTYAASLQVGQHVTARGLMPRPRFSASESFIFSETLTGQPFYQALPQRNEAMLRQLSDLWWLENRCPWVAPRSRSCTLVDREWHMTPPQPSDLLAQALAGLFALAAAAVGVNLPRRQHRSL